MYASYVVYVLMAVLLFWGFKFGGFKGFNDDFLDKNSTKAVCGYTAIFVILHHISQRPAFQDVTKELFFFNDLGYMLVTVFLFCSGYGLVVSAKNNPNYLESFKKKRIFVILIPLLLSNVVFSIYSFINGRPLIQCLLGLTGFIQVNDNGWYPFVLLVLYGAFYFAHKHIKKPAFRVALYFFVVILMISIFCVNGHFAWWAGKPGWWLRMDGFEKAKWWMQQKVFLFNGEWWVNSSIGFVVGAIFGYYKEKIVSWFKKGYWIKLLVLVVLFVLAYKKLVSYKEVAGYWTEFGSADPGIKQKFIASLYNLPVSLLFIVTFVVLMMKFRSENPITRFLGKISYETYLFGLLSLDAFNFLIFEVQYNQYVPVVKQPYNWNLIVYVLCVILSSILVGFLLNKFDNFIVKKITKEKN